MVAAVEWTWDWRDAVAESPGFRTHINMAAAASVQEREKSSCYSRRNKFILRYENGSLDIRGTRLADQKEPMLRAAGECLTRAAGEELVSSSAGQRQTDHYFFSLIPRINSIRTS